MRIVVFILFGLVAFPRFSPAQENPYTFQKRCTALGAANVVVGGAKVFSGRYPSMEGVADCPGCKAAAERAIRAWLASDAAQWERLSNEACSYELGWVERNPGECKAGGPPPVCPADHWVRRPADARRRFAEMKLRIANTRAENLQKVLCRAWRAALDRDHPLNGPPSPPSTGSSSSPFPRMPCSGGCPPGYRCVGGFCTPETAGEQVTGRILQFGEDKVANAAVKRAIVTAISMMGERARQATVSMTGRVTVGTAAGALFPPSISMWRDHYEARARSINSSLSVLNGHYAELDSYLNGGPARAPDMISADIRRTKAELNDHITNLSHAYAGVTMERELPRGACYEVFEYEHMRLLRSWSMLATLPDGIRP